jgi:pimeloyl-ACP methyl ester carboxylesterase/DNA-binding CsgD family transcriptional regulator
MTSPAQQIRFCTTSDGVRIAYTVTGKGIPLVRAPHWLTHIEHDWQTPIWSEWLSELSRGHSLLRFDQRGCGLSDWNVADISFEGWLRDLEAVVDAAGFDRFALFGMSQGASIAVEYAARHPERVTKIVSLGAYARGKLKRDVTPQQIEDAETQLKLVELGWRQDDPAYRQVFASQFMPDAPLEKLRAMSELMRVSASSENAVRIIRGFYSTDVREAARKVSCPVLLLHGRDDVRVPFEEGRLLAGLIPGARLVPLATRNHVLLTDEPAWKTFVAELRAFLGSDAKRQDDLSYAGLSQRETEVLEQLAQGLDNAQIAARLDMAEKTVRNHVTHIFDKLQVDNRSRAIVLAREAGMGQRQPPASS